ncbi:MAG TPA: ABC transporter ATP-binding protein [Coriobacteriia bacterium]|jgi:putative ABC transport system ATP-binding protein
MTPETRTAAAESVGAAIIEGQGLTRIYGAGESAVTALDDVDISVAPGEYSAVMGPSGCGKSTLLHLLGGLDRPTSGSVLFEGHDIAALDDAHLTELRRRRMGFVFQFFNLIPVLSSTENAALPLVLDGVSPEKAAQRANEWLERFGLGDRLRNRPDQLSGGQQQRVALARALVAEPALILADEPTGNLDSKSAEDIAELLKQVASEFGRSVVMVTHDARTAAHADRVLLMKDGRIVDTVQGAGEHSAEEAAELVKRIDRL